MKNILKHSLVTIIAIAFFAAVLPGQAQAAQKIARTSAALSGPEAITQHVVEHDDRAEVLKQYLESYGSPMADHAQTFIDEADKNDLDWKLVASIAGLESRFGQMIPGNSYNGWGFGIYGNHVRYFNSWDDGITTVTQALRVEYMDARGAQNVYQIGSTYAADPNWANKVIHYMNEIDAYSQRLEKPSISITL